MKHTLMHKNRINAKHKRYQIFEVNTCLCGLGGVFFFFLGCQLVLNRRRYSLCLSTQQCLHFANLGHRIPIQSITGMTIQLNRVWSARVYFSSMMLTQNSLSGIIPHLQWSSWVMVSRQKYFFCRSFNYADLESTPHNLLKLNCQKKKMKRQSCEEIPFIFLFHQYWNNNNKNAQNQNYHIHVLVNPKIHVQGHVQIRQDSRTLGLPNSAGL